MLNSVHADLHHPAAQFACQIHGFGDSDERIRQQQAAGGVLPAHQGLGGQHLAGAHVDLRQVVQHQRAAVDDALQMKLDVVAERAPHRHVVGEHRDLVAAGALCVQHRLIGLAQQIGGGVAAGLADGHTDADGPGEHLAVDGHPFPECVLEGAREFLGGFGAHLGGGDDDEFVAAEPGDEAAIAGLLAQTFGEHPDEPVAGVVAEIVVDGLEPVQVEEQHCDGSASAGRQPGVEMGHECAAIVRRRSGRRARPDNGAGPRRGCGPAPGRAVRRSLPAR